MEPQKRTPHWTVEQAAASLNELAYLERALAHIWAGWIPRISNMAIKVELGRRLYQIFDRATQLRRRFSGLTRANASALPVRQGCQRVMKHVDSAPGPAALLA